MSVGGDLGKKCKMLIYPSRNRRGAPRECVLELIGFPVSRSGSPQGSRRASSHLQAPQTVPGGPQESRRASRHPRPKSSECGGLRSRAGPPDTSRHPRSSLEALGGRAGPPDTSRHPKSSPEALRGRAGTPRVLGRRPWGQPRNGVSFTTPYPGATAKWCFLLPPKSLFGDGGPRVIGGWGGEELVSGWGLG